MPVPAGKPMHPTEPPARLLILRHAPLAVAGLAGRRDVDADCRDRAALDRAAAGLGIQWRPWKEIAALTVGYGVILNDYIKRYRPRPPIYRLVDISR